MSRYFLSGTPWEALERLTMSVPNFRPQGHGQKKSGFRYRAEDLDCQYCTEHKRSRPCTLLQCDYLEERLAAGALCLRELIRECFASAPPQFLERLERSLIDEGIHFFAHSEHRRRWYYWRDYYYSMSRRNKAAMLLLTAYDSLWTRMLWKFDSDGFAFNQVKLSGLKPELYSVYQMAKTIATGNRKITLLDLADPELVTDEAFQLIIGALLLAKYGEVILNFDGWEEMNN